MDALLATFLAETSFEQWRKHTSISLEEESIGKRVDRVEEMTIPSDLEDKLAYALLYSSVDRPFTPRTAPSGPRSSLSFNHGRT